MSWIEEFEHGSFDTPEKQEAARSTLSKFSTMEDAVAGYVELEKSAGKPYKLPESIDKLPDDNVRNEFKSQARKVLGIEDGIKEDQLKEINWTKGLEAGTEANQALVEELGKYAVEKGMTKSALQDFAEFTNKMGIKGKESIAEALKANAEQSLKDLTSFFGVEGLKTHGELLRRAAKNQGGLSESEYEEIAEELKDEVLSGKGVMTKMLMNFAAKLEKEGHNEPPGPGDKDTPTNFGDDIIADNPETAKIAGWT